MKSKYVLLEYYIRYLRDIRKVSESSIKHYTGAINLISKVLVEQGKIEKSIYEVKDLGELEIIKEYLYREPQFIMLNERGHRMYSVALNNYYKFAKGENFSKIKEKKIILDGKMSIGEQEVTSQTRWKRSNIIKNQTIEMAEYKCEINEKHRTFISDKTRHSYMEGHHAVPMYLQDKFENSLDIYANVVCVCPICHRLLHYGIIEEKEELLNKIYVDRSERLANSGIKLSKSEFVHLVG